MAGASNPWTYPRNNDGQRNSLSKARRWDSRLWLTSSTSTGSARRTAYAQGRGGGHGRTERKDYAADLEDHLRSLLDRAESGTYGPSGAADLHVQGGLGDRNSAAV